VIIGLLTCLFIGFTIIVDARGLSCPQPVLLALNEMKKIDQGEIVILVDTDTSRENVSRAATAQGWEVKSVESEGVGYRITVSKE
jgi:TusA-related sulfurtransferase